MNKARRTVRPELLDTAAFAAFVATFNNAVFVQANPTSLKASFTVICSTFAAKGIARESGFRFDRYGRDPNRWTFSA